MSKKIFIYFSSLFILFFCTASSVYAFTISPVKYSISIDAGESQDFFVTVRNDSKDPKDYLQFITGVGQNQKGETIFENDIEVAENWVKFNDDQIKLNPGEEKKVIYKISIPQKTPPGAHHIGLGIQEKNDRNISTRLATILNIQVAGTATEGIVVEKFNRVGGKFFDKKWLFDLQLKNTGNVGVPIHGEIKLLSTTENEIFSNPINFGNDMIVGSVRNVILDYSLDKKFLLPGLYKAIVQIEYGLTKQQIIIVEKIVYLPSWFVVVMFLFVFLTIVLTINRRKHVQV